MGLNAGWSEHRTIRHGSRRLERMLPAAIGISFLLSRALLVEIAPARVLPERVFYAQGVTPKPASYIQRAAPSAAAASAADEIVTIERLTVTGSRLAAPSVQYLSGLHPGMKVNEAAVRRAAQRIADSGLVKNVGYQYQSLSSVRSVELEFTIADEMPLLPATIQIPDVEAEDVWAYLHSVDPLFTRELPRTQKAIAFYTRYIERFFSSQKRVLRVASVITADEAGNAAGIVFVPASLLGTPQFRPDVKGDTKGNNSAPR